MVREDEIDDLDRSGGNDDAETDAVADEQALADRVDNALRETKMGSYIDPRDLKKRGVRNPMRRKARADIKRAAKMLGWENWLSEYERKFENNDESDLDETIRPSEADGDGFLAHGWNEPRRKWNHLSELQNAPQSNHNASDYGQGPKFREEEAHITQRLKKEIHDQLQIATDRLVIETPVATQAYQLLMDLPTLRMGGLKPSAKALGALTYAANQVQEDRFLQQEDAFKQHRDDLGVTPNDVRRVRQTIREHESDSSPTDADSDESESAASA